MMTSLAYRERRDVAGHGFSNGIRTPDTTHASGDAQVPRGCAAKEAKADPYVPSLPLNVACTLGE